MARFSVLKLGFAEARSGCWCFRARGFSHYRFDRIVGMSTIAFTIVKLMGAVHLIHLGVRMWMATGTLSLSAGGNIMLLISICFVWRHFFGRYIHRNGVCQFSRRTSLPVFS